MKQVSSIAPGKIILTGEHSVVYGEPALLAALGRQVEVSISSGDSDRILIQTDAIGFRGGTSIDEVVSYWKKAFRVWESYIQLNEVDEWKAIATDPLVILKVCLGLVYDELGSCGGVDIQVKSSVLVGSGMGSSASLATALIGGLGSFFGVKWSKEDLYERVYTVEQIAHGRASGADPTAVVYGGVVEFVKEKETKLFKHHSLPKNKGHFQLINSGKPAETTGELVSMVHTQLLTERQTTQRKIDAIGKLSRDVIKQIEKGLIQWDWISENERLLEDLGVVGLQAQQLIRSLEGEGIMAKVCGAGGVAVGSGMILAYHLDWEKLQRACSMTDKQIYPVVLGVEGWHLA